LRGRAAAVAEGEGDGRQAATIPLNARVCRTVRSHYQFSFCASGCAGAAVNAVAFLGQCELYEAPLP